MNPNISDIPTYQLAAVSILSIFLVLSLLCSGIMLVSLVRRGDERKNYILMRTCTQTFLAVLGIMLAEILYSVFLEHSIGFRIEDTAVFGLGITAVLFTVLLFVNKKKYSC